MSLNKENDFIKIFLFQRVRTNNSLSSPLSKNFYIEQIKILGSIYVRGFKIFQYFIISRYLE